MVSSESSKNYMDILHPCIAQMHTYTQTRKQKKKQNIYIYNEIRQQFCKAVRRKIVLEVDSCVWKGASCSGGGDAREAVDCLVGFFRGRFCGGQLSGRGNNGDDSIAARCVMLVSGMWRWHGSVFLSVKVMMALQMGLSKWLAGVYRIHLQEENILFIYVAIC